jgi:hypothetical protein
VSEQQGDRGSIDWKPNAASGELPDQIMSAVNSYHEGGYPAPTVRDVYYRLLGLYEKTHGYDKDDEQFKRKVYRLLTKMRRTRSGHYRVAFDAINDDSPTRLRSGGYKRPENFWRAMRTCAETYRRDLLANQPTRVVVFTEGAGEVRQFNQIAREYHIPVYSGGGWDSLSIKYETGLAAANDYRARGRKTLILHAGDFDPDGVWLYRAFVEDALAFAVDLGMPEDVITTKRVMTHPEQVLDHGKKRINRETIKKMNHRGQAWPHAFKAEMQSIALPDRLRLMREAIEAEVDHAQVEADRQQGEAERAEIVARIEELLDENE